MKITDLRPLILSGPLDKPVRTSFGTMTSRPAVLVEIETDEGIVGVGESWVNFPHWAWEERRASLLQGIRPLVLGEDPRDILHIHSKLLRALFRGGAGLQWGAPGPLMQAISGVDIALWDILGKRLGCPIYRLLGGAPRGEIPAYASGLGPQELEEPVRRSLQQGFSAFKLKVGFGRKEDLYNLGLMRDLIGSRAKLMIDANQAWRDADEALGHLKSYREFNIEWVEEPVPAEHLADLQRIRRSIKLPVAGGENLYGRQGFLGALAAGALDVVQPDLTKTGGITEGRIVCEMAACWDLPFAPHMFGTAVGQAASLQLLAAVPGGLCMEVDVTPNPLLQGILKRSSFVLAQGAFQLQNEMPGLGIELDKEVIRELSINSQPPYERT